MDLMHLNKKKAECTACAIPASLAREKDSCIDAHSICNAQQAADTKHYAPGREVSFLDTKAQLAMKDKQNGLCAKRFKADILTSAIEYSTLNIGDRFEAEGHVFMVSRKKGCYEECELRKNREFCPLRHGAIFATVIKTCDKGCTDI